MGAVIQMTKAQLDDFVKELIGPVRAEIRAENEKMGKLLTERGAPPDIAGRTSKAGDGVAAVPMKVGGMLARTMIALVASKHGANPVDYASKRWGKGVDMEPVLRSLGADLESRSLQAGEFVDAGALLEETVSDDFIEALTPATVVRSLGAMTEPMPTGSATMRKQTGTASASYVGENNSPNATKAKHGQVKLSAKQLVAVVAVSNKAIRWTGAGAKPVKLEERVRLDAINQVRIREDLAFIRDPGSEFTPKGIFHWIASGNKFNQSGTTHQAVVTDTGKVELLIQEGNVQFINPGWMWAPRSENFLKNLLTADGHFAFRAEMIGGGPGKGTFGGWPFRSTTQIPKNIGGNQSEVYGVDFSHVVIGDGGAIRMTATAEGAYYDEDGNLRSAFADDVTVIRIEIENDLVMRHAEAGAVIQQVTWGV